MEPFAPDSNRQRRVAAFRAAAQQNLAAHELSAAVDLLAAALSLAPDDPQLTPLIDALSASHDAAACFEAPLSPYFAHRALRSRWLASRGRHREALDELLDAVCSHPDAPLLPWALDWVLHLPPGPFPLALFHVAASLAGRAGSPPAPPGGLTESKRLELLAHEQVNREAAASLLVHFARAGLGEEVTAERALDGALLCRAAGRPSDAALFARRAEFLAPSWRSATELALAARSEGDLPQALLRFQGAAQREHDHRETWGDIGDTAYDLGELTTARAAYSRALELSPHDDDARVGLVACRLAESSALTLVHPAHQRAAALASLERHRENGSRAAPRLLERINDYDTSLPGPLGAWAHVVSEVSAQLAHEEPQGTVSIRGPAELALAPSAQLAFQLELARQGKYGFLQGQAPDFESHPLWRPPLPGDPRPLTPRVSRPTHPVTQEVRRVAASKFDLCGWRTAVHELIAPVDAAALPEVLALLAYPDLHSNFDGPTWLFRVQVAAALALSCAPRHSDAHQWLRELVLAPWDWSAGPAALAVSAACASGHWDAEDASALFDRALQDPSVTDGAAEHCLVTLRPRLSELSLAERTRLWRRRRRLELAAGF